MFMIFLICFIPQSGEPTQAVDVHDQALFSQGQGPQQAKPTAHLIYANTFLSASSMDIRPLQVVVEKATKLPIPPTGCLLYSHKDPH